MPGDSCHAAGSQEHDILGAFDESQGGELLDPGTRCATGEGEVIVLDSLDRRQRGDLHQGGPLALDAGVVLEAQEASQEVPMAGVLAGALPRDGRPLAVDPLQLQDIAELFDSVGVEGSCMPLQQRVIDRQRVLEALLRHRPVRSARHQNAMLLRQRQQRQAFLLQPLDGLFPSGAVQPLVGHPRQPPTNAGVGRRHIEPKSGLLEGCGQRDAEDRP